MTFVNGTNSYPATVVTTYPNDANVVQVMAPAALPASGTFTVNVSNGYGHNGNLAAPYITLSRIAAAQGNTDIAMQWANEALEKETRSAEAHGALGEVYEAQGKAAAQCLDVHGYKGLLDSTLDKLVEKQQEPGLDPLAP